MWIDWVLGKRHIFYACTSLLSHYGHNDATWSLTCAKFKEVLVFWCEDIFEMWSSQPINYLFEAVWDFNKATAFFWPRGTVKYNLQSKASRTYSVEREKPFCPHVGCLGIGLHRILDAFKWLKTYSKGYRRPQIRRLKQGWVIFQLRWISFGTINNNCLFWTRI